MANINEIRIEGWQVCCQLFLNLNGVVRVFLTDQPKRSRLYKVVRAILSSFDHKFIGCDLLPSRRIFAFLGKVSIAYLASIPRSILLRSVLEEI